MRGNRLRPCKQCDGERVWEGDSGHVRYVICTDCGDITGVHDTYARMTHVQTREEFHREQPPVNPAYGVGTGYQIRKRRPK